MILSGDGKKMVLSKQSTFTEAVAGKDYSSLVSAESRAVGLLSSEIAQVIKTLPDCSSGLEQCIEGSS